MSYIVKGNYSLNRVYKRICRELVVWIAQGVQKYKVC